MKVFGHFSKAPLKGALLYKKAQVDWILYSSLSAFANVCFSVSMKVSKVVNCSTWQVQAPAPQWIELHEATKNTMRAKYRLGCTPSSSKHSLAGLA